MQFLGLCQPGSNMKLTYDVCSDITQLVLSHIVGYNSHHNKFIHAQLRKTLLVWWLFRTSWKQQEVAAAMQVGPAATQEVPAEMQEEPVHPAWRVICFSQQFHYLCCCRFSLRCSRIQFCRSSDYLCSSTHYLCLSNYYLCFSNSLLVFQQLTACVAATTSRSVFQQPLLVLQQPWFRCCN